jgi:hypothetical protein
MLPQHLITDFWFQVENSLEKRHDVPEKMAREKIAEFIALSEKHDFSEMVYHRNPDEVAETIAGGLKRGGFEEPKPVE